MDLNKNLARVVGIWRCVLDSACIIQKSALYWLMWCRGKNLISAGIGSRKSFLGSIFGGRFSLKGRYGEIDGGGISRNVKFPDINERSLSASPTTFSRNKLWLVTLISSFPNNCNSAKTPMPLVKRHVASTFIRPGSGRTHANAMTTPQNHLNPEWGPITHMAHYFRRCTLIVSE